MYGMHMSRRNTELEHSLPHRVKILRGAQETKWKFPSLFCMKVFWLFSSQTFAQKNNTLGVKWPLLHMQSLSWQSSQGFTGDLLAKKVCFFPPKQTGS